MATQVLYTAVSTVSMVNGISSKLVFSSIELCISAAGLAIHALRPSQQQPAITENPLVKEDLQAMDIEAKLQTIQALVFTIQKQRNRASSEQQHTYDETDVVDVSLTQVKEVLDSLTKTFHELQLELATHEEKWFSSWRTPNTQSLVTAIKSKMLILDKRVDMLLKVRAFVKASSVE